MKNKILKTPLLTILLILAINPLVLSQEVSIKKRYADSLFINGFYTEADLVYQQLADSALSKSSLDVFFEAKGRAVESKWRAGYLAESKALAKEMLTQADSMIGINSLPSGLATLHLGVIDLIDGKLAESEKHFFRTLKNYRKNYPKDHPEITNVLYNLGAIKKKRGYADSAIYYFKMTLNLDKAAYGLNDVRLTDHYNNLGAVYQDINLFEKATLYYDSSIQLYKEANLLNHPAVAVTYGNMGTNFSKLGRFEEGIAYLFKALKLYQKSYKEGHFRIIQTYQQIGFLYYEMRQFSRAKKYVNKCIQMDMEYFRSEHSYAARNYNLMGTILLREDKLDSSMYYLKKAKAVEPSLNKLELNIAIETNVCLNYFLMGKMSKAFNSYDYVMKLIAENEQMHYKTISMINIAASQYFLKEKDFPNAAKYVDLAISANQKPNTQSIYEYIDIHEMLFALKLKAKIYQQSGEYSDLIAALEYFNHCHILLNEVRMTHNSAQDLEFLNSNFGQFYENAITAAYDLYQLTDSMCYLERAFVFSEAGTADDILRSSNISSLKHSYQIPDSLILKEEEIQSLIRYYQSIIMSDQLAEKPLENDKLDSYTSKLVELQEEKAVLQEYLKMNHNDYYQIRYEGYEIGIEEVRKVLSDDASLIRYFAGDSFHFCFLINKEQTHFLKLPAFMSVDLINDIEKNPTDYNTRTLKDLQQKCYEIYLKVFKQVDDLLSDKHNNHLIIIPHGELNFIPFDLLVRQRPDQQGSKQFDNYLINKYQISYAFSAQMIINKGNHTAPASEMLAIAPQYKNGQFSESESGKYPILRKNKESALLWNVKEVQSVASDFDTDLLLKGDASEANFKSEARKYRYIHIAGHAFNDPDNPELSNLSLSVSDQSNEDGRLYFYELANMSLPADLVVLSACSTAGGQLREGKNINSIGYAFQLAGAKAVVVSQWPVDDKSTSILMNKFYQKLKSGLSKSEALRTAKLEFVEEADPALSNPFYWAPFVIYGDNSAIENQSKFPNILLVLIGFLIALALLIAYRKVRFKQ
ncbi:MAG: CHAT domain-containing tetratricopeptide repeat protein [Bacteroidota bacterium]